METVKVCAGCGAQLPADAPHGLCPECLLKAGLETKSAPSDSSASSATPPPPTPSELAPHFPQLEIIELLGQGGMGMVYKARQSQLDRMVALKILPLPAGQDAAFAGRFTREARSLARLSHPNIVAVHDFGQAGGYYYFVMEFVDGMNLRQMLQADRISPVEALAIVPKICDALQYAHDEGIVHRDIKPENILLDKRGRVKIADFGLAKLLAAEPRDLNLTSSGMVMGTPRYMAPEQMTKPNEVDHRADIYSLGVVFYEMLTGDVPVGRFPPPSHRVHVDVRLDEVVLRALESAPERRYQQVSEVRTDVESIVGGPQGTERSEAQRPAAAAAAPAAAGIDATLPPGKSPPTSPGQSVSPTAEPALRPRFSRKAIIGAVWAPWVFAMLLGMFVVGPVRRYDDPSGAGNEEVLVTRQAPVLAPQPVEPPGAVNQESHDVPQQTTTTPQPAQPAPESPRPTWWQWFLRFTLLPAGLLGPIGTTILGILALHDIRHSRGRVTGLPLALADALFYPLLALDAVIYGFWYLAVHVVVPQIETRPSLITVGIPLLLTLVTAAVVDGLVVFFAWRGAKKPVNRDATNS